MRAKLGVMFCLEDANINDLAGTKQNKQNDWLKLSVQRLCMQNMEVYKLQNMQVTHWFPCGWWLPGIDQES